MLQWGHVDEDVEETQEGMEEGAAENRFNGATSMKTWKSTHFQNGCSEWGLLQWGHVDEDVEEAAPLVNPDDITRASMGPRR